MYKKHYYFPYSRKFCASSTLGMRSPAIVHTLRYTMTEFSRSSVRDSISIIEMGERIQFTSVYRQDFLTGSCH